MGTRLALLALVLAVLAVVLQLTAPGGGRSADAGAGDGPRLADLVARVEALEQAAARAPAPGEVALQPAAPRREAPADQDPRVAALEERVAALEGGREGLLRELAEGVRAPDATERRREQAERDAERLAQAHDAIAAARDPLATEEELLRSLRTLRGKRLEDGTDARVEVLDEMLALARTSEDGDTRADVWRQLSHVTDPRLRQPLLNALAWDEHAGAREEAAETLADFLPDAEVELALRNAAENDPDDGVREQARDSLRGR